MNATHANSQAVAAPCSAEAVLTSMALDARQLLALPLQAGDSVHSRSGTVWITVDGLAQDIVLAPGEQHTLAKAMVLNLSAMDSACAAIHSHGPLTWRRIGPAPGDDGDGPFAGVRHWWGEALARLPQRVEAVAATYNRRLAQATGR